MARRRTGERIGAALEGFAGGFLPTYFQMQDLERRKLSDRHRFLTDVGGQIGEGWKTEDQLEPYIQEAMERGMTREEAMTALSRYVPTEEQRGAEIYRRLGDNPLTYTRAAAERIAAEVGVPEYFQGRRALPSRPIPGLGQRDVTGAVLEPSLAQTTTPILGGRQMNEMGGLMAPLSPRPFVPGATGGTPLEWGGPQAKLFEQQQQEAIASQRQEHQRGLIFGEEEQRQQLATAEEFEAETFDAETERMRERMETLSPVQKKAQLEIYTAQLAADRANEELKMDPKGTYSQRYYAEQKRHAELSADINQRTEWINRVDSKGVVRTFGVTKDVRTGQLIFTDWSPRFGATKPWVGWGSQVSPLDEALAPLIQSVVVGLSERGQNADFSQPEGMANVLEAVQQFGGDAVAAERWLKENPTQPDEGRWGLDRDSVETYIPSGTLNQRGRWIGGQGGEIGAALRGGLSDAQMYEIDRTDALAKIANLIDPVNERQARFDRIVAIRGDNLPPGYEANEQRQIDRDRQIAEQLIKPWEAKLAQMKTFWGVTGDISDSPSGRPDPGRRLQGPGVIPGSSLPQ